MMDLNYSYYFDYENFDQLNNLTTNATYDYNYDGDYNDTVVRQRTVWEKLGISAGIIMMIVCIFGIVGNVLSLMIFVGPQFRRISINTLLTALSAVDLCLVIFALPTFVLPPLSKLIPSSPLLAELNVIGVIYCYPFTTMFQTASVWLLILVTIERWCAVKHPLSVKVLFTRRRALYMIVTTISIAVVYNIVRFWEFRRVPPPVLIEFNLRNNQAFMMWYVNVAGMVTMYIVPLSILCILNLQVVFAIIKARNSRQRMSASELRDLKMTKSMGAVVLVFVVCDSFAFALNIIENFDRKMFHTDFGLFLSDSNNLLVIFNSASTWIFYLMFSTRYRLQAKKITAGIICGKNYEQESGTFDRNTTRSHLLVPPRKWGDKNSSCRNSSECRSPIPGVGGRRSALIGDSHQTYQKIGAEAALSLSSVDDRRYTRRRSRSYELDSRTRSNDHDVKLSSNEIILKPMKSLTSEKSLPTAETERIDVTFV